MSTHTPSPWTCDTWRSPADIKDATGDTIAKVYLTDQKTRRRNEAHLGNARLMTAAPDMLQALKRLLDDKVTLITAPPGSDSVQPTLEAIRAGLAAIAKAEGR